MVLHGISITALHICMLPSLFIDCVISGICIERMVSIDISGQDILTSDKRPIGRYILINWVPDVGRVGGQGGVPQEPELVNAFS